MPLGPRPEPSRRPQSARSEVQMPPRPPKPPQYQPEPPRGSPSLAGRVPVGPRPFTPTLSPGVAPDSPISPRPVSRLPPAVPRLKMPEPPKREHHLPYPVEPGSMTDIPPLQSPSSSIMSMQSSIKSPSGSFSSMSPSQSIPSMPMPMPVPEPIPMPMPTLKPTWVPEELLPVLPPPQRVLDVALDLPELPPAARAAFSAEQLTVADFDWCKELWSLSGLAAWLLWLMSAYDADVSRNSAVEALAKLFVFRIAELDWPDAEALATGAVESLEEQGVLTCIVQGNRFGQNSEQVVLTRAPASGVLPALTGHGCYSWSFPNSTSCYSSRCLREAPRKLTPDDLRRAGRAADLREKASEPANLEMDWSVYWAVDPDVDSSETKRQYALHELIMSEESYVRDLELYMDVYGKSLEQTTPSVMENQAQFAGRVFGRIAEILAVNQPFVAALRRRQQQQGPFVRDVTDLVVSWARSPQTLKAYSGYADDYLWAENHLRKELPQNPRLTDWMAERGRESRLRGRPHSFFFHRVIPRLARYEMLLQAVAKHSSEAQKETLEDAKDAVVTLARECDARIDRQQVLLDVHNLRAHIVFKTADVAADLKLGDKHRRLLKRGDAVRRGRVEHIRIHLLLLDNFLVLSKLREGQNGTALYVTKAPIPLDLLVLEPPDEPAMHNRLTGSNLVKSASSNSVQDEEEYTWPLRITHLGIKGQSYLLLLASEEARKEWADAIIEAQRVRAAAAFARAAEPFRLNAVATCFAYPDAAAPRLPVPITSTALHRSLPSELPQVLVKRRINCFAAISPSLYLVGNDLGVCLGHLKQGWTWTRALDLGKVTALEVIDTFNVLLVNCEKGLVWYALDQVVARGLGDSRVAVGHRLTRQRRVLDFGVAFHRGRVVVMYLQADSSGLAGGLHLNSAKILKVIEPVRSRGLRPMRRLPGLPQAAACVESFREIDRVTLQGDTVKLTPLVRSILVHNTSRGFEHLTLDAKIPQSVPSVVPPGWQQHGKPLRVVKIDSTRLLLCYEMCCVLCTTSGDAVTDAPVTWFLSRAVAVAYEPPYLVVVSADMVEIRLVSELPGRLVQLIVGRDIALVGTGPARLRLAHPTQSGRQLLVELVANTGEPRDYLAESVRSLRLDESTYS